MNAKISCVICGQPAKKGYEYAHLCDKHFPDSRTDGVPRCADCGKRGERTGHQDCQFPENH